MTSQELLKADVLDILFENKNKAYGAYALRKFYNYRLATALTFSISFVVLLTLFARPEHRSGIAKNDVLPDLKLTNVVFTPEEIIAVQPPPQQAPVATRIAQQEFIDNLQIRPDEQVPDALPEQSTFETVAISNHTVDGIPGEVTQPIVENDNNGHAANEGAAASSVVYSQSAPEFPGGQNAWMNFLNRHLRSPDALEPGDKKTVLVRFLVSSDGSITQFEVLQSGGNAFDNEVIRVLKKMPKWKPAAQNGQNVAVTFTQPVTFIGEEE